MEADSTHTQGYYSLHYSYFNHIIIIISIIM
jgi:hypothetical protein